MEQNNSSAYMQTTFDKAFVGAVSYLISNKRKINKFFTQKELLTKLNILPQHFTEIKKAKRGVPNNKIIPISEILVKEYGVSPTYLKTGTGHIMRYTSVDATDQVNDTTSTYSQRHLQEMAELKLEIKHLKQLLHEKEKYITLQDDVIASLKTLLN